jgi:hypothetical protein
VEAKRRLDAELEPSGNINVLFEPDGVVLI